MKKFFALPVCLAFAFPLMFFSSCKKSSSPSPTISSGSFVGKWYCSLVVDDYNNNGRVDSSDYSEPPVDSVVYTFNADGTGSSYTNAVTYSIPITWSLSGRNLMVNYSLTAVSYYIDTVSSNTFIWGGGPADSSGIIDVFKKM